VPLARDGSLTLIEALQQERSIVDGPAMDCGVVNGDAALGHHLLKIPQAQAVSQVPPDAQQDHGAIQVAALEHAVLHEWDQGGLAETLKQILATDPKAAGARREGDLKLSEMIVKHLAALVAAMAPRRA
jgi:hypothetical protein